LVSIIENSHMTTTTQTDRIRALNDELRQHLIGGTAVITPGIAALGWEALDRIVKTIAVYDDFCHANDPYGEHDFGSFEVEGETIFFKIDYLIEPSPTTLPILPIRPSPNGSSRSCSPTSTDSRCR
jgi:uncharacterized protein DUF3768